jgi:hypothetical protein
VWKRRSGDRIYRMIRLRTAFRLRQGYGGQDGGHARMDFGFQEPSPSENSPIFPKDFFILSILFICQYQALQLHGCISDEDLGLADWVDSGGISQQIMRNI